VSTVNTDQGGQKYARPGVEEAKGGVSTTNTDEDERKQAPT
jgi:hypothetical protein